MSYYYYCAKIKDMMKLSKSSKNAQLLTLNGETIFVKHCKTFDDFIFQYSWIITNESILLPQVVKDVLEKYQLSSKDKMNFNTDVIQMGLITLCSKDGEDFSGLIQHCKSHPSNEMVDTSYILCGKKVLRLIQYCGKIRCPLEYIGSIPKWNTAGIQSKEISNLVKGVDYSYSEDGNIIFYLGVGAKKTVFMESISDIAPEFIKIDNFLGIEEHRLINFNK